MATNSNYSTHLAHAHTKCPSVRCLLIITWMSNTKEVHSKPRLHVSLSTCYLEYGRHVARLRRRRRRRRRRAYAPTSNTASHDNHEKINSWVSFCFPYMGCLWGSDWQPFGPPELRYYQMLLQSVCTKCRVQTAHRRCWTVIPRPINISALMMKIKRKFYRSC